MKTRKLEIACPQCGSKEVFYSCTPGCCFNHVCSDCGTTFEPATTARATRQAVTIWMSFMEPRRPSAKVR